MIRGTDDRRRPVRASDDGTASPGRTGPPRIHMTGAEWFSSVPGGLNRYFTDLYQALRRSPGVHVSAAAFGDAAPGGWSWGPIGGSTVRRASAAFFARPPAPEGTIIDRHFCLYGPPAAELCGRHHLVVHFHGPWAAESRAAGSSEVVARLKYWIERSRYVGAERYVVLSRRFRDLLAETYRVPESRIRIIPPGVDLDRFQVSEEDPVAGTVLCVRRLERRMGIDVLLRCWPDVVAAHPEARLTIVGTGGEEAALRAQASDSGLSGSVRFEGRAHDERLAHLYQQAALTVVPSVALEGFGLIALESLAVGRAPIVTDCGGLPDAVRGLDPSLIVPAADAEALAGRIIAGLDGEVPAPDRCRAHAASFSWPIAAARHVAMYEELISG